MFSEAEAYERFMGRWSRLLAPGLVDFAEIHEGDAVLDVGSGTGALSFAARVASKTGRITGIDAAQDYVRDTARKNSDPHVAFEVGDAQQLTFPDAMFDKTLSALVLNFIPDPARALREMVRVTKPGGMVTAAIWDYGDGMTMLRVFWDEAIALDPAIAPRDEARMPFCREGELSTLWRHERLENVQEVPLRVPLNFASFDDYWAPFLLGQGPAGAYAVGLPLDHRSALEQRLRHRLLAGEVDRPIHMHARAWAVKGTVPPNDRAQAAVGS
jgi:SAM-dependent methyltransferase